MSSIDIVVLALIRGTTEFLPVDFAAHAELVAVLSDWPEPGRAATLGMHVGALLAVALFVIGDLAEMVAGVWRNLKGKRHPGGRLFGYVLVSATPLLAGGYLLESFAHGAPEGLEVVGWATVGFGLLLLAGDGFGMTVRRIEHIQGADAIVFGLVQALALIPGASRAGLAITAGRVLGLERREAARFALIMAIPALLGAASADVWALAAAGQPALSVPGLLSGGAVFLCALVAIGVMMVWLRRRTFLPFVVYRLLLGGLLLMIAYGWAG